MPFDKESYRKNRAAGKRGQGEETRAVRLGLPLRVRNRADSRQKIKARIYRDADDKIGVTHTRLGAPKHNHQSSFQKTSVHVPASDPNESNHQRVLRQRRLSGRLAS